MSCGALSRGSYSLGPGPWVPSVAAPGSESISGYRPYASYGVGLKATITCSRTGFYFPTHCHLHLAAGVGKHFSAKVSGARIHNPYRQPRQVIQDKHPL